MADIGISTSVFYRDEFGRFASAIADRVEDAMDEVAKEGAAEAKRLEPQLDFFPVKPASHEAAWASDHPWAVGLDRGIPPHLIQARTEGKALANKEKDFGPVPWGKQPVQHPGVKPRLFFERSYARIAKRVMKIIARYTRR